MNAGEKIARFYTAITVGVVACIMVVFYVLVSGYMDRVSYADLSGMAEDVYKKDLRTYMAFLSVLMFILTALLLWLVGKFYASRIVDRLEVAYKSEKDFISNASHEINNPLTAIQGECEITLLKERTPQEYQGALQRIAAETKRIILLMKHLLFLSHGNKEILRSAVESVMLADFLMQFAENRVRFSPDSFGFGINANPHLLKIAIGNLVDNALKYSGDEVVDIRLRSHILEIEDRGIGIPEEELEGIAQPFYRAANTRGYPGHGIGLSLSIRILQTYGATVEIVSKVGVGTLIRIIF